MSMNGHHTSTQAQARRRRNRIAAIVAVIVLLAFGGGFVLATDTGGNDQATVPSPSTSTSAAASPSASVEPSASVSESPSPSPTSSPGSDLTDGRYFGLISGVDDATGGGSTLRFDLAYFYTGAEADAQAAARGDETPVPNGYYIVNDNPKLRDLPISPTVKVRYIPEGACCDLQPGTFDGLTAAANGTAMSDYPTMSYTYWWITIAGGQVVKIEQQFLP